MKVHLTLISGRATSGTLMLRKMRLFLWAQVTEGVKDMVWDDKLRSEIIGQVTERVRDMTWDEWPRSERYITYRYNKDIILYDWLRSEIRYGVITQ